MISPLVFGEGKGGAAVFGFRITRSTGFSYSSSHRKFSGDQEGGLEELLPGFSFWRREEDLLTQTMKEVSSCGPFLWSFLPGYYPLDAGLVVVAILCIYAFLDFRRGGSERRERNGVYGSDGNGIGVCMSVCLSVCMFANSGRLGWNEAVDLGMTRLAMERWNLRDIGGYIRVGNVILRQDAEFTPRRFWTSVDE
ncbi:hypothetical protein BJ875DRAFT_169574 [Amylocarpus encephaloides]|uniref:Uncharacterized protein n=1 Tax=Amylocarpus encephaloides TaxID=45428 RepID=A0A9P7YB88_9HELO|nr:hypothetical protein BJ875DRAFT_169574 [Amylocarpus encephaloides]